MHRVKMVLATAVAAWSHAACASCNYLGLQNQLSSSAQIYCSSSPQFASDTARWSALDEPQPNVVVVPGTEHDVAVTVQYANAQNMPFLAYSGAHGSITTLGQMKSGIEINLSQLTSVTVNTGGQTATIGGGAISNNVTHALWAQGKQTVTGTCECVSLLGPGLGGGHGWLQGHHGLVADQFVSMNVVLADGSLKTVDSSSDLFWAMQGAGHNFGIVTSLTTKVYDIQYSDWAIETLIFSGTKVQEVYQAANDYLLKNGTQPAGLINWSYWLNIPSMDPANPVILFYIIQEGVKSVDPTYTTPFRNLGPLSVQDQNGTYLDLGGWTGIAADSAPCQKGTGLANPRFPLYLDAYNPTAMTTAYNMYASNVGGSSVFNGSIFMFEGYSMEGVHAIPADSTAFAFRSENILTAPLIQYKPTDSTRDTQAKSLGDQLRNILFQASGDPSIRAYVNYAYGDETPQQLYGADSWRQSRLQTLKQKYDPHGRFNFYAPV